MKIRKRIRFFGESILVCVALLVIPFLPRCVVVGLARRLGRIAFFFCGGLKKVAMANLDIVFGADVSDIRKEEIIRGSFTTFALLILDLFWFTRFTAKRIGKWAQFDRSFDSYHNSAPAVVVTAHLGNWEVMGQAAALHGEPCVSVAVPLQNAFVEWIMLRMRRITGQHVAPREGAIGIILRALRKGGRTALLLDQNTLPEEGGAFVRFFGRMVPNSMAAGTLALRVGCAVVFVYCVSDEDGHYRVFALPPIPWKEEELDALQITQRLATITENIIKEYPDQWLWMYKRWKYIPEGEQPDDYPFYARKTERKGK